MRRALRLVAAIGKNAFSDEGITSLTLPLACCGDFEQWALLT